MTEESIQPASYEQPVEIAEGIFWGGYVDRERNLHCNPYLVVDGNEAVLIDGGSRPEFSIVMLKIPTGTSTWTFLLSAVDVTLYAAKKSGRNRVIASDTTS